MKTHVVVEAVVRKPPGAEGRPRERRAVAFPYWRAVWCEELDHIVGSFRGPSGHKNVGYTCKWSGCAQCRGAAIGRVTAKVVAGEAMAATRGVDAGRPYLLTSTPLKRLRTLEAVRDYRKRNRRFFKALGNHVFGGVRVYEATRVDGESDERCPACLEDPAKGYLEASRVGGRTGAKMAEIWASREKDWCRYCGGTGMLGLVHYHMHAVVWMRPVCYGKPDKCRHRHGCTGVVRRGGKVVGLHELAAEFGIGRVDGQLMKSAEGGAVYLRKVVGYLGKTGAQELVPWVMGRGNVETFGGLRGNDGISLRVRASDEDGKKLQWQGPAQGECRQRIDRAVVLQVDVQERDESRNRR